MRLETNSIARGHRQNPAEVPVWGLIIHSQHTVDVIYAGLDSFMPDGGFGDHVVTAKQFLAFWHLQHQRFYKGTVR